MKRNQMKRLNEPEFVKRRNNDDDDDGPDIIETARVLDKYTPTIYLSGIINDQLAKNFRDACKELEYIRRSDIALVVIDSPGGLVDSCWEILNIMKSSNMEFMTYCVSHACSAAAVILSAGAAGKRFMAPLSYAMIHQIASGTSGHIEEIRSYVGHLEAVNAMLMGELAKNCNTTLDKIVNAIKSTGTTDLFLIPAEAKALGLVDEIGYVNLAQARAYQLEVITDDPPAAAEPDPEPEKPKKAPRKKKPEEPAPEEVPAPKKPKKTEAPTTAAPAKKTETSKPAKKAPARPAKKPSK